MGTVIREDTMVASSEASLRRCLWWPLVWWLCWWLLTDSLRWGFRLSINTWWPKSELSVLWLDWYSTQYVSHFIYKNFTALLWSYHLILSRKKRIVLRSNITSQLKLKWPLREYVLTDFCESIWYLRHINEWMRYTEISILPVDHLKCHLKHIVYCFISLLLMEIFVFAATDAMASCW